MKKLLNLLSSFVLVITLCSMINYISAGSPNYGYSKERYQLWYEGYVQILPEYNENGFHARRGALRYYITGERDTGWVWTEYGKNQEDTKIYSRKLSFRDSLNPASPATQFRTLFDWVEHSKFPYAW